MTPLKVLKQDVQAIYSLENKKNELQIKTYNFENNKITITFGKIWLGQVNVGGVDMQGSATVQMQQRDSHLEDRIKQIIEKPDQWTHAGFRSIVKTICFF